MHVIAVTGMPGAGKELAAELAQRRGWPVLSMGELVRAETRRRGLPADPQHVAETATALRKERGPGAWAELLLPLLEEQAAGGARTVLVDGVRNVAEVEVLRRALGGEFVLVGIAAEAAIRHERLIGRGRSDDVPAKAWLEERDRRELGYGLGEVLATADHTLRNESTKAAFREALERLLDEIGGA